MGFNAAPAELLPRELRVWNPRSFAEDQRDTKNLSGVTFYRFPPFSVLTEKLKVSGEIGGKRPCVAKASIDSVGFMRKLPRLPPGRVIPQPV